MERRLHNIPLMSTVLAILMHGTCVLRSVGEITPGEPLMQQDFVEWRPLLYLEYPVAVVTDAFHYLVVYAEFFKILPVSCDVVFFAFGLALFAAAGFFIQALRGQPRLRFRILFTALTLPLWFLLLLAIGLVLAGEVAEPGPVTIIVSSTLFLALALLEVSFGLVSFIATGSRRRRSLEN